jgi:site-specific DNA recombinase
MSGYVAYIRVSTARQGARGVSLQEQRDAIERYALSRGFKITQWFEERETAAKCGRPVFAEMIRVLEKGRSEGVIVHKVDRSVRNLSDWVALGRLADDGLIELHFVSESLDFRSRGGRLAADIQAVIASDYIRNLREEIKKGFYGRVKQGLYPIRAPLGYLDCGAGKPKALDPKKAPIIRELFELYGTGRYSLQTLRDELFRRGLRNLAGGRVSRNGLSTILNNPFYMGVIRLRKSGEVFQGIHEPMISTALFERVQRVLQGKCIPKALGHEFLFSRLFKCRTCGYSLVGEQQKGHVYYRCHMPTCVRTSVKEEVIEATVLERLTHLEFSEEVPEITKAIAVLAQGWSDHRADAIAGLRLRLSDISSRIGRLTDAYVEHLIDRHVFQERHLVLLTERKGLEEQLKTLEAEAGHLPAKLAWYLERLSSTYSNYKSAPHEGKRAILQAVTSNRTGQGKEVDFSLQIPFNLIAARHAVTVSRQQRYDPRTLWQELLPQLWDWATKNPTELAASLTYHHNTATGEEGNGAKAAA